MNDRLKRLIVTGLGTGYLPIAPGTWGSAGACALFLLAALAFDGCSLGLNITAALIAVVASIGCVATGRFAQQTFGRKDPSQCTSDEWAGQAVTLLALPFGEGPLDWIIVTGVAFLAFRVFDIFKPPPVRQLEKLPFGWGVLLDDIAAGIYANLVCQILFRVVLTWPA